MFRMILVGLLVLSTSAKACETQTIVINGKVTVCTICPNITTCN